jgi:hypothetical protein
MNRNGKALLGIIIIVVLVVVAAAVSFSFYNKFKPVPYTNAEGRFTVTFPGKGVSRSMDGRDFGYIYGYCCDQRSSKCSYEVDYWDFPVQWSQTASKESIMDAMIQLFLTRNHGVVVSKTDATYSGYPCRELLITRNSRFNSTATEYAWVRMFFINNRSYAVIAASPSPNKDIVGEKFLDSFKVN